MLVIKLQNNKKKNVFSNNIFIFTSSEEFVIIMVFGTDFVFKFYLRVMLIYFAQKFAHSVPCDIKSWPENFIVSIFLVSHSNLEEKKNCKFYDLFCCRYFGQNYFSVQFC